MHPASSSSSARGSERRLDARRAVPRAAAAILLTLALGAGCSEAPPASPPASGAEAPTRPHLVFALVDTLRADHVGAYGHARDTTPFIDRPASEGVLFEEVVAQSSWTQPSLASIMTSRYPAEYGADTPFSVLPEEAVTLAETLSAAGYASAAFVTNPHAAPELGIMQGFDRVEVELKAPADRVVDRGLELLDAHLASGAAAPFFLYLHFMDVHVPLTPPDEYAARFAPEGGSADPVERKRSATVALYDAALAFVDAELARLEAALGQRGLLPQVVFAVSSDHGEMYWERVAREEQLKLRKSRQQLGTGHGYALFPELLRIPLVLRAPDVQPARIERAVRGLDIAPTLLGVLGVAPPPGIAGVDLLAAGAEAEPLPAHSLTKGEEVPQVSLVRDGWQYLRVREDEFLHRWSDPALADRAAVEGERLAALRRELEQLEAAFEHHEPETYHVPPELVPLLEKLGYAQKSAQKNAQKRAQKDGEESAAEPKASPAPGGQTPPE